MSPLDFKASLPPAREKTIIHYVEARLHEHTYFITIDLPHLRRRLVGGIGRFHGEFVLNGVDFALKLGVAGEFVRHGDRR